MNNSTNKKNIIAYNILSKLFSSITTLIILIVLIIIFKEKLKSYMLYINIGLILLSIYFIFRSFISPFIDYKTYSYNVDAKKIEYTSGIFTISRVILPINRVQQVILIKSPLLNKFNLVKIQISTTSNSHTIRNLTLKEGENLVTLATDILKANNTNKSIDEVSDDEL